MDAAAGKYLTFRLGHEEYGIEVAKVVEIIQMTDITAAPCSPECVRGVINLRGRVIPVVELRRRFRMAAVEDTPETCIIVVAVESGETAVQMGIVVDTVSEVLDIEGSDIEPPPRFGGVDTTFIMGMSKARGEIKILLDINKALSSAEMEELAQIQDLDRPSSDRPGCWKQGRSSASRLILNPEFCDQQSEPPAPKEPRTRPP
jgi:purine-binding chemotaxis protein CheW